MRLAHAPFDKSHKILEKGPMDFRPFGTHPTGKPIRDVSGITVKANVEYLAEVVTRSGESVDAKPVLQELADLLNARIPDPAYHVTPKFLTNPWHSYSYEFVMYLAEFSVMLSQDPDFHRKLGRDKFLSPIIQMLGRPFSIPQIYKMFPHFVEKYTKGALQPEVISVSKNSAILRLRLSPHTRRQFGLYARSCAERICQSGQSALTSIPSGMFHMSPAQVTEHCCMADGADYCEWHLTWQPKQAKPWAIALGGGVGIATFGSLSIWEPYLSDLHRIGYATTSTLCVWIGSRLWKNREALHQQRLVIQEQLDSVETQHEELQQAYVTQGQTTVELQHRLRELTMYHHIAQRLSATLDQEAVIRVGLQAITQDLHFDRAMISLYDSTKQVVLKTQIMETGSPVSRVVQDMEVPITDPESVEGHILLSGQPVFSTKAEKIQERLHPLHRQLFDELHVKAFIGIPLKFRDTMLGALIADRTAMIPLMEEDVRTLTTVGHHIALALNNAQSFRAVTTLNEALEEKVRERTFDLEQANQQLATANSQLHDLDRMKSTFLSHCSHELRTPLAAIKGFSENLLEGFAGPLNTKQETAIRRINTNSDRLTRLIADLLDLSQIEAGRLRLHKVQVNVRSLAEEVVEHLQPLLAARNQQVTIQASNGEGFISADRDRITQILLNLIHNASKFTPERGVITVTISRHNPEGVSISVKDPGPGIPEKALAHLFDPFFQAHRDQEGGSKGLGLGLAIVKQLVDLHHGTIRVETKIHSGTTFHIALPSD